MKLESQLHLGYCMGMYASDVGSQLYFESLLFSGLKGFALSFYKSNIFIRRSYSPRYIHLIHYGENHYRQTIEGRILHPLAVLLLYMMRWLNYCYGLKDSDLFSI